MEKTEQLKTYRMLTFYQDRYKEQYVEGKNLEIITGYSASSVPFFRYIDTKNGKCMVLDGAYRSYEIEEREILLIGDDSDADIFIEGIESFEIRGRYLIASGEIYVNGEQKKECILQNGDKIFRKRCEIIYGGTYVSICTNQNVVTDLDPYINEHRRFEGFPEYRKSPRIVMREPRGKVSLDSPMQGELKKKGELIKRILPGLVMILATILMSFFMKRGAYVLVMAAVTLSTLIVSIVSYADDKKMREERERNRIESYKEYLLRKRKELHRLTEKYRNAVNYQNLSQKEIEKEVWKYSSRIYERTSRDSDFLHLSLGYGNEIPSFSINCQAFDKADASKDPLNEEMKKVYMNFQSVKDIPCVVDLKKVHLGLVGKTEYVTEMIFKLVTQLAFYHSYHDIVIIPIIDEDKADEYQWMKQLPHARLNSINVTTLLGSEKIRDQILGHINRVLKERSLNRNESRKESSYVPHFIFVIENANLISSHSIMEHLKSESSDLGFSLIYTSQMRQNLPENIRTVMTIDAEDEGTIFLDDGILTEKKIRLDAGRIDYERFARGLRPLIHNTGVNAQIPEKVSFMELMDICYGNRNHTVNRVEDIPIHELWKKNHSHKSLSVPIGLRGAEDVVYLDLHEKSHGPHGLVAGTTGSGKSEILQSFILSLSVNFHPHDVGFLLIDYKGGGMADLFSKLPHLMGTITNLDGDESMRALVSIKAEIRRREAIFKHAGVQNIIQYTEKFKNGLTEEPLPHLFIISDEFAELKKEQPEFMSELVSTARVGRSLGIHLILATQKPAGIVDDQIWSNSRFKLCLKVQTPGDSRELLKTDDAANITQPGRAYLQVGNNEIYEQFQSAYSGAPYIEGELENKIDERLYVINDIGQGHLINRDLSHVNASADSDQLKVIVSQIASVFSEVMEEDIRGGAERDAYLPMKPWLPSLEKKIINPHISAEAVSDVGLIRKLDTRAEIGLMDEPECQMQNELVHDFMKDGNLGIFGAGNTGRSTVLLNAALTLAVKNNPELLNYYVLDFGNAALIALKDLPHTADYIVFDDEEKRRKLKGIILEEIRKRKKLFGRENASSLEMYNRIASVPLQQIILFIDNYDVVKEMGFEEEDFYVALSRDGASLGINMIVSASRSASMKYSVFSNLNVKISEYQIEKSELSAIVGRNDYKLNDVKGRGLVKKKGINIVQQYLPVELEDAIEYAESIRKLVSEISLKNTGELAERIPVLPDKLKYDYLIKKKKLEDAALGLDSEAVDVKYLGTAPLQIITGPHESGKTNILKLIYSQKRDARCFVVDGENHDFQDISMESGVEYLLEQEDYRAFMAVLENAIDMREAAYASDGGKSKPREFFRTLPEVYVLFDDWAYFSKLAAADGAGCIGVLERALKTEIRIIVATSAASLVGIDPFTKFLKSAKYGIIKGKTNEQQIFPAGSNRANLEIDEGIVFENGRMTKIKIPLVNEN